jgi:hypothetical protein
MATDDVDRAPLNVRVLVDTLKDRWSAFVWHREEMRRVVEMGSDDKRLNHCASSY